MFLGRSHSVSKDEVNAYMGARTAYQGKLTFQGAVHIDGTFTGEITSDGILRAGKDSVIEGSLEVGELELSGTFTGEVHAKRRVLIHRGGVLTGTIFSPVLAVEEGAVLEGTLHMREPVPGGGEAAEALPEGE